MRHQADKLRSCFRFQTAFPLAGLPRLASACRPGGLLDQRGKVCAYAVGHAQQQFHGGIAQPPLHQTQHGLRHPRTLGHSIVRELSFLSFLPQETHDLHADGFIVSGCRHAELSQRIGLDTYFAIVKSRRGEIRERIWSMASGLGFGERVGRQQLPVPKRKPPVKYLKDSRFSIRISPGVVRGVGSKNIFQHMMGRTVFVRAHGV